MQAHSQSSDLGYRIYTIMISTYIISILFISFLFQSVNSSSCGSAAIPFSLESLPNGQPILGCSRPKCFGWTADSKAAGSLSNFALINRRSDGFMRESIDDLPDQISSEDAQYFKPQVATCELAYGSQQCSGINQWVGGISPSLRISGFPLAVKCCEYEPLRNSTDRGIAIIGPGQIFIGGEVIKDRQYAFDYISNIVKHSKVDGSVYYKIDVRRMACIPHPKEFTVNVDTFATNEIWSGFANYQDSRLQVFEAPLQVVAQSRPLQEIGSQLINIQQGPIDGETGEQGPIDGETGLVQLSKSYGAPTYINSNQNFVSCSQGNNCPTTVKPPTCACYYCCSCCQSTFCFSADTSVRLSNGAIKRMDELSINDWVMSSNGSRVNFASVSYWIHKMPKIKTEFIRIELTDGKVLKITSKHYIYKTACTHENEFVSFDKMSNIPVFAEKVEVGDCLYVLSEGQKDGFEQRRVQKIDMVEEVGIYSPMTSNQNIIVNDIYASCFNIINHEIMQDTFIHKVKKLPLVGSIFGESEGDETDLPYGTSMIVELMTYVLPTSIM